MGGRLKDAVAIGVGRQVIVSQHIGDLDTLEARGAFERAIDDLCRLYDFKPELIACDLHPDYASTRWARRSGLPVVAVQHHRAHVASCAAENDVSGPYLGFGWDGTGYGDDGTIWGGEVFLVDGARFERVAHLRTFRLPGGEAAIREGWRSAASLLWTLGIEMDARARRLAPLLDKGLNAPLTSSVGRLFDAASALAGVAQESRFEGQAAMLLEREIGSLETAESYAGRGRLGAADPRTRWRIAARRAHRREIPQRAGELDCRTKRSARACRQVVLSGGVFQNRYLTERAATLLEARGIARLHSPARAHQRRRHRAGTGRAGGLGGLTHSRMISTKDHGLAASPVLIADFDGTHRTASGAAPRRVVRVCSLPAGHQPS